MNPNGLLTASSDPLVTIAIPTFNRAAWLKDCVFAALAQTYDRFEVLVSNNSSTDDTAEVLHAIGDPRLRVLTQKANLGPIANQNACLAAARGTYVVFLPDDDWIAPWLLERCVALLRREPAIPIVLALSDCRVAPDCKVLPAASSQTFGTGVWDGPDLLQEFLQARISPVMCTILVRTDALRAMGGFPSDWPHLGDISVWASLLLSGRAGLVNEACGTYRVHNDTQSVNFTTDVRLKDLRRLSGLIEDQAEHSVDDPKKRRDLQREARRYLAGNALYLIALRRKSGASFKDVVPEIWRLRADLKHIGVHRLARSARSLAIVLFPAAVTNFVRWLATMARRAKSDGAAAYRHENAAAINDHGGSPA